MWHEPSDPSSRRPVSGRTTSTLRMRRIKLVEALRKALDEWAEAAIGAGEWEGLKHSAPTRPW